MQHKEVKKEKSMLINEDSYQALNHNKLHYKLWVEKITKFTNNVKMFVRNKAMVHDFLYVCMYVLKHDTFILLISVVYFKTKIWFQWLAYLKPVNIFMILFIFHFPISVLIIYWTSSVCVKSIWLKKTRTKLEQDEN